MQKRTRKLLGLAGALVLGWQFASWTEPAGAFALLETVTPNLAWRVTSPGCARRPPLGRHGDRAAGK